ncbi:MAG: hypothetical protein JW395_3637 [Nitrospira sp.]|nr:hypothetical protein [Nitrospira sp.]
MLSTVVLQELDDVGVSLHGPAYKCLNFLGYFLSLEWRLFYWVPLIGAACRITNTDQFLITIDPVGSLGPYEHSHIERVPTADHSGICYC